MFRTAVCPDLPGKTEKLKNAGTVRPDRPRVFLLSGKLRFISPRITEIFTDSRPIQLTEKSIRVGAPVTAVCTDVCVLPQIQRENRRKRQRQFVPPCRDQAQETVPCMLLQAQLEKAAVFHPLRFLAEDIEKTVT